MLLQPSANVPKSQAVLQHAPPADDALIADLATILELSSRSDGACVVYVPGTGGQQQVTISYRELQRQSEQRKELVRRAAGAVKIVLLHFDSHEQNIVWLWATVLAGYLPAVSTPLSSDPTARKQHMDHLKSLLEEPAILTSRHLLDQMGGHRAVAVETLAPSAELPFYDQRNRVMGLSEFDPALLMLTSGSSGNAKAVALSTHQMISSVMGKSHSWSTTSQSVFLNWIGLDHVACLAEVHLHAMILSAKQVHVQAGDLLSDPVLFLRLIDRHRVTHTFAPHFFLELLDSRLDEGMPKVNLSCLRSIMSGGEANAVRTAERLSRRIETLGAAGNVIRLGYGLTESCAAMLYGMLDVEYEKRERHEYASVGKPIEGAKVRIGGLDRVAEPYEVGDLEISGPMVFQGYYNNKAATLDAFTPDGWFMTGDRAYIDHDGKVNIVGRSKELILINGVKYPPQDLEGAIERSKLQGIVASYVAVFAYRPPEQNIESYCVVYGESSQDTRQTNAYLVARLLAGVVGARPDFIISLPFSQIDKSSLGKISRAKLRSNFERGLYDEFCVRSVDVIRDHVQAFRKSPATRTETFIVQVLSSMMDLPEEAISTNSTVFEIGITSISLFRFEQVLRARMGLHDDISIITLLSNPIIEAIGNAIDNHTSRQYNPVVKLQTRGDKTPLWLAHPASGNVLAFLPLSRTLVDRPLYALTARGLSNHEKLFTSIEEMCDVYYQHVKATQPTGPYALTGYSLGTTVAFELARRLEANGDEVAFCAALDSPPHVIPLVQDLDWAAAAVLVCYFIELIGQDEVPGLIDIVRGHTKEEIIAELLQRARPAQRALLNLDNKQLLAIVNVTDNFGSMAKVYHPTGTVRKIDVFYCTPLHSVERSRETWVDQHLQAWQEFSRDTIEFHDCEGDHADMLNPTYVETFKQRLLPVLAARGI